MRSLDLPNYPGDVPLTAWRSLDPAIERRLEEVLGRWVGTPYLPGQRSRGIGADCVQLVAGVFDELEGKPGPTPIPRLRGDSGVHGGQRWRATILGFQRGFVIESVRDGILEPGDVIVGRSTADRSGPHRLGHALIVSAIFGTAVHAVPAGGVCRCPLSTCRGILRVYRPKGKDQWPM